jgi:D-beta-D-heptose 7-phosphate kinase/D-beta-D-heptose 1-phosphate adenosyltransferase
MNSHLTDMITGFAGLNILVIGEAMLDSYLDGRAASICREAPVPVVRLEGRSDAPGGAANTAANVCGLGASVRFLSVVGDDSEATLLRRALAERGVPDDDLLVQPGRRTLAKHRVRADAQMLVRFDQGDTGPVDAVRVRALVERLESLWPETDAVIVSDYGYGLVGRRVLRALADLQTRVPRVLVADSKDLAAFRTVGVTAAKPNYGEAIRLLGALEPHDPRDRPAQIEAAAQRLLDITGAKIVAVTLDVDGGLVLERDKPVYRTYTRPTHHSRAAGAGDTFVAALTLAIAAGAETATAAELAAAAAAVVVEREGTSVCAASELREHLTQGDKHLEDMERLAARVALYRQQGRRIVFTNGCFDIIHRGHVTSLSQAKSLGDVLIVGVNSDSSVRRRKGPARPINTLEERVGVLAGLSSVDAVIAFDEDTPENLIRAIAPDVFAKGGDYTRETLPEAAVVEALGGIVHILPYMDDRSTTGIIERIRAVYPFEKAVGR